MGLVISLCDFSGNVVKPWLEAGHDCVIVDIKHEKGQNLSQTTGSGRLYKLGYRVEEVRQNFSGDRLSKAIGFAMPPCTDVAVSGALHFRRKGLAALIRSLTTLEACIHILEQCKMYALENPVSTFSTYYRKPDHIIDPFEYADQSDNFANEMYPKKTCLWTSSNFTLPKPTNSFIHDPKYIRDLGQAGQEERSVTPLGLAYAIFNSNKHLLDA